METTLKLIEDPLVVYRHFLLGEVKT